MARKKTTLNLEDEDYRRLRSLARAVGRAKGVGAFASGRGDLGERAEDLLEGFGRRRAKKR